MWSPTHAHVIVHRAENLLIKGKNDTNNAFVTIELGKESYRTSVKEKSGKSVSWNEECELKIPSTGNKAYIILTAFHRNSIGFDQFLGLAKIPLVSFDKYERRTKWFKLEGKPGKEKGKDKVRGKLEVEIGFISKAQSQSLTSLQSKKKSVVGQLTGSLFGLTDKKKGNNKLSSTLHRMALRKRQKEVNEEDFPESNHSSFNNLSRIESYSNLDPGVVSDEDENNSQKSFDSMSSPAEYNHNASNTSISASPSPKPQRFSQNPQISISFCDDENNLSASVSDVRSECMFPIIGGRKKSPKLALLQNSMTEKRLSASCVDFCMFSTPVLEKKFASLYLDTATTEPSKKLSKFTKRIKQFHSTDKKELKRTVIGCEAGEKQDEGSISPKTEFRNKNKDELIRMVLDLQKKVNCVSIRVKDLEDYLDGILLKVMETVPKILEKS